MLDEAGKNWLNLYLWRHLLHAVWPGGKDSWSASPVLQQWCPGKKVLCRCLKEEPCSLLFFFLMKHHLLGRMTDDELRLLRLGYLADFFFFFLGKKVSLSLQGKQLAVFIAKTLSFQVKLRTLENLYPTFSTDSFPNLQALLTKINSNI